MQFLYVDDLHCHLRQGELMKKVVKYIRKGGCNRVLVMPNTVPEITSCSQALEYRNELLGLDSDVDYLMTLYLSSDISVDDLKQNAKNSHVQGVKCYPFSTTINSERGFKTLETYYPVFSEMEKLGLSLHIHGENPNSSPMTAEVDLLKNIEDVCRSFPNLKVVLEHITSSNSLDVVKRVHNLGATVTPHHMVLTASDVLDTTENLTLDNIFEHIKDPFLYCKPIAKYKADKEAILDTLRSGHPRVFLGSDSAPHPMDKKLSSSPPAGIYTQPFLLQYLAHLFDTHDFFNKLEDFCCKNGKEFLGLPPKESEYVNLMREGFKVPEEVEGVKPFLSGQVINYSLL